MNYTRNRMRLYVITGRDIALDNISAWLYNPRMKKNMPQFLYTLTLSLWVGGMAIFTFIATPAIFRSFDRDMAGKVVGALFDGYFGYNLALSAAALVLLVLLNRSGLASRFKLSAALVIAAILMNCAVSFAVYPEIKRVKAEVASFVTMPKDSDARKRFSKLHAISAVLNLLIMADGLALLYMKEPDGK